MPRVTLPPASCCGAQLTLSLGTPGKWAVGREGAAWETEGPRECHSLALWAEPHRTPDVAVGPEAVAGTRWGGLIGPLGGVSGLPCSLVAGTLGTCMRRCGPASNARPLQASVGGNQPLPLCCSFSPLPQAPPLPVVLASAWGAATPVPPAALPTVIHMH